MSGITKGSVVDPSGQVLANCKLFMYRRSDGTLLGSAVSNDSGNYELTHTAQDGEKVFVVCLDNDDSPDFEGIVRDRITISNSSTGTDIVMGCDGATSQVQLMNDSNSILYNNITSIIIDGVTYLNQGFGNFGFPDGMPLTISTDLINGNYYITFKNIDTNDHRIELVGYAGDINDTRLNNNNPTLAYSDNNTVIFCLAGFNLLNISCEGATHQVAVFVDADEVVDGLYTEITLNQQSYRIDAIAGQRFYDTICDYVSQNLSDYLKIRDYQALDPNISYDPHFFFLLENISDQALRLQIRTSSDSTTLTGSGYAEVSFMMKSDDGYNPSVWQLDQNANARYGNYTVCLNSLSDVKIQSDAENTIQAQLIEGMLVSNNIQQIQFENGDLLNLNTGLTNISAERAGLALCILKPDSNQDSDVRLAGPALVEVISYPTRELNRIWHVGSSASRFVPAYPSLNLIRVPAQCPNVHSLDSMFRGCEIFNDPNISNWDVSKVTNMKSMFYNAIAFNQDLSLWCVANISTLPDQFAVGSSLTSSYYPVWGTCPRGENA